MREILKDFKYRNEDDKAYGLAGMILTLGSLDALTLVHSISLDAEGPMVEFTDTYYHLQSPALSAKGVWEALRHNFYVTAAVVVGNVMARAVVRDGTDVPPRLLASIRDTMISEGADNLNLEEDETDLLYRHLLQRNVQIFHNPRLHPKVQALSRRLALLRTLSGNDIAAELERL